MFTSNEIKKAWTIRKEAAKKWNCSVMEIVWSECLKLAMNKKVSQELIEQRYELYNTLSFHLDMGGLTAFPGSKIYTATRSARRALVTFDNENPEVKGQPNSGGNANEY